MSVKNYDIVVLKPYEEAIGTLWTIFDRDGAAIAQIGRIMLLLPLEMGERLQPFQGIKIGVLRTDIRGREFLFRVIPEERPDHEMETDAIEIAQNPSGKIVESGGRQKWRRLSQEGGTT